MQTVKCAFQNGSAGQSGGYSFKTNLDVKVGDLCLADTSRGIQIVEITEIDGWHINEKATKWIFQIVDVAERDRIVMREDAILQIEGQLKSRLAKLSVRERFAELAKLDPVSANLLAQLEKLENGTIQVEAQS